MSPAKDDDVIRILPAEDSTPSTTPTAPVSPIASKSRSKPRPAPRLVSLDAFRGFIMLMLAAHGFGILALSNTPADRPLWSIIDRETTQRVAFHFNHPPWQSSFVPGTHDATIGTQWLHVGVSFWDLIQPAFMFMVGVSLPLSISRRETIGQSKWKRGVHAFIRSVVLVLMGVFLYSLNSSATNWIFPNVLAQIGLGYFFVYLLTGQKIWIQTTAFLVILVGTWATVHFTPPPTDYVPEKVAASRERGEVYAPPYRQWSKNGNAFSTFDRWFLNLFPRAESEGPFEFNRGGYQTLNFVPSMATMLLGVFCGQILLSQTEARRKVLWLILLAVILWGLGVITGATCCPIVKRIWTPSWVLFSGGYVVGMLAIFALLFDVLPLKALAFPFVVIGANSLLVYFLGELLTGWLAENVRRHFGGIMEATLGWIANTFHLLKNLDVPASEAGAVMMSEFAPVVNAVSAVVMIWLFCYWLYRQKIFLRI
jgi:Uncharacterized conserved protein